MRLRPAVDETHEAQRRRFDAALAVSRSCPAQAQCAAALPKGAPRWGVSLAMVGFETHIVENLAAVITRARTGNREQRSAAAMCRSSRSAALSPGILSTTRLR